MSATPSSLVRGLLPHEVSVSSPPSHELTDEKKTHAVTATQTGISSNTDGDSDTDSKEHIIVSGTDASKYLLPLRDDGDAALTFRGIVLATILSGFQAVMNQIYTVGLVGHALNSA